ncbi:MAG: MmgE/PrpD family protein [Gemmataceae bacterium]|nr:MmgE/PrpD family protein [Gemmataceae bacterium]
MTESLARKIARFALELRWDDVPSETIHELKRRLLDSLGTALGALNSPASRAVKACALNQGNPSNQVSLIGGGKSAPDWGAFYNGLLIRYLDFNDTYLSMEPAHPSDNLAAVLAAGEREKSPPKEMILAGIIAYEIQCRLCDAASLRKKGIDHVTYGTLSATAAVARLMELTLEQTVHALGIAAASGIAIRQTRSGELSMWKGCAFGNVSRHAIFAAQLAKHGLTGPAPIFEGDLGLMKLITGPFEPPEFGAKGDFMINRTYIKYWPAEYHSQSAIAAALVLRGKVPSLEAVSRIEIHTFHAAADIIGKDPEKWRPKTRETADHSLPYCTVVALVDGQVGLEQFDETRIQDPQLVDLVNRTTVIRDENLDKRYPKGIPNRIVLRLKDGSSMEEEIDFPPGHAQCPMTDDQVIGKFLNMAKCLGEKEQKEIIEFCLNWENRPAVDHLLALTQADTN